MPDRRIIEKYLDLYHHSFACHVFPVVDPARFKKTLDTAYSLSGTDENHKFYSAQACVYAFLAFTSFFNFEDTTYPIENPDDYALKAHRLLSVCCLDVCIETLQGSSMMVIVQQVPTSRAPANFMGLKF